MTREEIISIATKIAELRKEVARLSAAQKELRMLEARLDGISEVPDTIVSDPNSLVERAINVVDGDAAREWTAEDVAAIIEAKVASTRAALSKAVSAERLRKCGRGRFKSGRSESASKSTESEDAQKTAA